MNNVCLIGNITKDPELKFTAGKGTAVCKVILAVRRDKENTDFIPVTIWGKAAETTANYCIKGSKIGICEGNIKTGSYDKDGKKIYTMDVQTMRIELLSSKQDGRSMGSEGYTDFGSGVYTEDGYGDSDIPF